MDRQPFKPLQFNNKKKEQKENLLIKGGSRYTSPHSISNQRSHGIICVKMPNHTVLLNMLPLQIGIKRSYGLIHNSFFIGWIIGILFIVF